MANLNTAWDEENVEVDNSFNKGAGAQANEMARWNFITITKVCEQKLIKNVTACQLVEKQCCVTVIPWQLHMAHQHLHESCSSLHFQNYHSLFNETETCQYPATLTLNLRSTELELAITANPLGQWFSTIVRLQPGKFFFIRSRSGIINARAQHQAATKRRRYTALGHEIYALQGNTAGY